MPFGFDPAYGDLDVSRETRDRLRNLVTLVAQWNPTIRLVADADEAVLWHRHVRDSLQLVRLGETKTGDAADIGSGAGFPGLVLAIALDRPFHLFEADRRKAAFLREAARVTGASVVVEARRAETGTRTCALITARAFASVACTLGAISGMLGPETVCLLPKGRSVEAELREAVGRWQCRVERFSSVTDPSATILRLSEIAHA